MFALRSLKVKNFNHPKTILLFHSNLSLRRRAFNQLNSILSQSKLNCKLNFTSSQLDNNNKFQSIVRRKLTTPPPSPSSTPDSNLYNRLIKNKKLSKYVRQFRSKPTSYIVSFLILHEVTAIVPIPIFYLLLSSTGIRVPFPQRVLDEGNKFINRVMVYYGYEPFEDGSRAALNFATSYAIVKVGKKIN